MDSLAKAGFEKPYVFVDDECTKHDYDYYQRRGEVVIARPAGKLLPYGHWLLTLAELYLRHPDAHLFAIFQDDLLAVTGLREYLEWCDHPKQGYWNLYTSPSNIDLCPLTDGRFTEGWYPSSQWGRGATGLVFSRNTVITLLGQRHMWDKPQDKVRGWKNIDGAVIQALKGLGYKEYVHYPALIGHVGKVATFDKEKTTCREKALEQKDGYAPYVWPAAYDRHTFPGEAYDARQLCVAKDIRDTERLVEAKVWERLRVMP